MIPLRAAALVLAVGSLAGLLLSRPPEFNDAGGTIVVATPGAVPAAVRRAADSARAPIYVLAGAGDALRFGREAEAAPDVAWILRRSPGIRRIIVAGWGLDDAELDQAEDRIITLAGNGAATLPAGIATVRWNGSLREGSAVQVRGSTTGLPAGTVVYLTGPDATRDSGRTAADSTFVLSVRPPAAGRFEYTVSTRPRRGGSEAAPDTLGVEVTRSGPPALLILDASPSFESRYLEDWLRQRGGSLALRTSISRNRYRTRFLNRPAADLSRLNAELLGTFDLVLLDARTLATLPPGEQQNLTAAINAGLGIIMVADAAPPSTVALLAGRRLTPTVGGVRSERVSWETDSGRVRVDVAPFRLGASDEGRVLASDSTGAPVAEWWRRGGGALAVSLVLTPSRWRLGGESEVFAAYWSRLIGAVARPAQVRWDVSEPGRVDAPVQLVRSGAVSGGVVVLESPEGGRDSLYLAQDPLTPARWEGTYWPRIAGWYRVVADSAAPSFYVSGGWTAFSATARHRATVERAAVDRVTVERVAADRANREGVGQQRSELARAGKATGRSRRVPDTLLFAVFLASVTVLWSARTRSEGTLAA